MANQERKVEPITKGDPTTPTASAEQPATNIVIIRDTVPVCIKLCEPICAESRYEIGIDIFERPVAKITIGGLTRFYNCREKQ
jgi:hypothetical protein